MELADVVSSGGVPVGGVETERVDGGGPGVGTAGSVAPHDDDRGCSARRRRTQAKRSAVGGCRCTEHRVRERAAAAPSTSAPSRSSPAAAAACCASCWSGSGLGMRSSAELVASLPGLEQLVASWELGRHGPGAFGVDLAAGPLDQLDPFGADGGEPFVEVEDALAEAASFVVGVQPVAGDAGPDAGAGDLQADAVAAVGVVGDAGELQGGALVPVHRSSCCPMCDRGRRRAGGGCRWRRSGR